MKGFHVYFGILLLYLLFACLVFFNNFAICYFSNERKKSRKPPACLTVLAHTKLILV